MINLRDLKSRSLSSAALVTSVSRISFFLYCFFSEVQPKASILKVRFPRNLSGSSNIITHSLRLSSSQIKVTVCGDSNSLLTLCNL